MESIRLSTLNGGDAGTNSRLSRLDHFRDSMSDGDAGSLDLLLGEARCYAQLERGLHFEEKFFGVDGSGHAFSF